MFHHLGDAADTERNHGCIAGKRLHDRVWKVILDRGSYKAPVIRKFGMLIFSWLASVLIRQRVTDPTSGYQALNIDGIRFYASDYYPVDFPDADVIIHALSCWPEDSRNSCDHVCEFGTEIHARRTKANLLHI
jgi:hypothetical protein